MTIYLFDFVVVVAVSLKCFIINFSLRELLVLIFAAVIDLGAVYDWLCIHILPILLSIIQMESKKKRKWIQINNQGQG